MLLELNEVLLEGEPQTLSLMAREGQITCLSGAPSARLTRWLHAMMGFEIVRSGYVSIDGEPFTPSTVDVLRRLVAFAPSQLEPIGQAVVFEPPSVQDVFSLKANRQLAISNGILGEEMRRIGATPTESTRLLAVAALLDRPILLADDPPAAAVDYLQALARKGRTVVVASNDSSLQGAAKEIIEISS